MLQIIQGIVFHLESQNYGMIFQINMKKKFNLSSYFKKRKTKNEIEVT